MDEEKEPTIVDTDDMLNYIYMRLLDKGFIVSEEHIEMILELETDYLIETGAIPVDELED
ncbi:MAG: YozD family protein [Psychrobacillus sp.]